MQIWQLCDTKSNWTNRKEKKNVSDLEENIRQIFRSSSCEHTLAWILPIKWYSHFCASLFVGPNNRADERMPEMELENAIVRLCDVICCPNKGCYFFSRCCYLWKRNMKVWAHNNRNAFVFMIRTTVSCTLATAASLFYARRLFHVCCCSYYSTFLNE